MFYNSRITDTVWRWNIKLFLLKKRFFPVRNFPVRSFPKRKSFWIHKICARFWKHFAKRKWNLKINILMLFYRFGVAWILLTHKGSRSFAHQTFCHLRSFNGNQFLIFSKFQWIFHHNKRLFNISSYLYNSFLEYRNQCWVFIILATA